MHYVENVMNHRNGLVFFIYGCNSVSFLRLQWKSVWLFTCSSPHSPTVSKKNERTISKKTSTVKDASLINWDRLHEVSPTRDRGSADPEKLFLAASIPHNDLKSIMAVIACLVQMCCRNSETNHSCKRTMMPA